MRSELITITNKFLSSKRNFDFCLFCNNGIKKATFRRLPKDYIVLDIKEYNPFTRRFQYVLSASVDILATIEQELNKQPIKPISIFRGKQKHN